MYLTVALARFFAPGPRLTKFDLTTAILVSWLLLFLGFMVIFLIRGRLLPLFHKGFYLGRAGYDVSFCHSIALVYKVVEGFIRDAEIFKESAEYIGDKDARLLCGKGYAHEEKDNSVSEMPELISEELPEDGIQHGFMLVMKPLVYPLTERCFADLGKA